MAFANIWVKVAPVSVVVALTLSESAPLHARNMGTSSHPLRAEAQTTRPQGRPQAPPPRGQRPHAFSLQESDSYRQSARMLASVGGLLSRTAEQRNNMDELPARASYIIQPPWTETREDREKAIRQLLDAVLAIVADAPVVDLQQQIARNRATSATLRDQIATLRERRMTAPPDGVLPGVLTETQSTIDHAIDELEVRIRLNDEATINAKREIGVALQKSGVQISAAQLDLLLDSVLGGDLVKLASAFQTARGIDDRLAELLVQSNEDIKAARRYFAMHTALFAMIVHAHDLLIERIDTVYLARLNGIAGDIGRARETTRRLVAGTNRPDQQRALDANAKAQELAANVARYYRDYLNTQRRQLAEARERTRHDLEIADNTFQTVEASFQLHSLMEDARASFEALKRLEAPGFDQVFKNDALRREFENLTRKLAPAS